MIVIVREGELTEDKKQSCYEYSGLFKIINRVSKLSILLSLSLLICKI